MTFTDWLRPKRTAYAAIAMVIAVTGVLAAAVAQWFALVIGAQVADTGGPVQAAYDAAHAMLWLAWVLPLALPALLVVPVLLFEALAWVVRVDSADDAWTSLAWLARAWRGWGAWMLGVIATTAVAGFVLWRIDGIEGAILALVVPWAAAVLSPLVFWNARNVAAVSAQAAWRPGWPGLRTLSFVVACIAAGIAVSMLVGRLEAPGFVVWPVLLVLQVASFAATAICVALWLDRGRAPLAVAARGAVHPRVLLPMALQVARLVLLVLLALAPLLPIAFVLILVVPQFEPVLVRCCELAGSWGWVLQASRFAVAWWWALAMVLASVAFGLLHAGAGVGYGRLQVQLGVAHGQVDT